MPLKNLILALVLFPFFAFAQNIKGSILDKKSNLPISDVNISLSPINVSTTTDEKGKFNLKTSREFQKNDSLNISHIRYTSKKISLTELNKSDCLIFLDEKTENLNGLTLTSVTKELKSKLAFTKLAPLKYAISSFGSILNNNKIYVIGGDGSFKTDAWKKLQYEKVDFTLNDYLKELQFQFSGQFYKGDLLIYDIKTNQWTTSKLKFRKRANHNLNIYNNIIYVLGGKRVSVNGKFEYLDDKIEVFDTSKETITIDNTNPHQAADFASFNYKNTIIAIGGSTKKSENGSKEYTNKVHSYDLNTGYWYELTNMPTAKEVNGILIKDKIYLIGGFNGKPLSSFESFDLVTETWKNEGELFNTLGYPAITHKDDVIYIFENEKIYTLNTNTKELKEYLINLPFKGSKLYYCDEKLYLIGGYIENCFSQYPSPNLFSIEISEFENTKPNRVKIL
ncbi:carboxypeptidase-like regulatory domain-containing protein [Flavobacterium granuli]|uniref:Kelch motif-containing protein n=1 Tax=Flavobacterium granuli TaxID=280093 RepID=A0ABU1RZN4_9FLAO|nr:carboxypeptidase-like regulatory domain-containing protein [Flavobacterium granuli]MDR6843840.1 hypothetical protein [Flavobacterium granuli]